jgi:hypothetical protein
VASSSDDIGDDAGFRDFCRSLGRNPIVVRSAKSGGAKYVGILVKPDASNRERAGRRLAT